ILFFDEADALFGKRTEVKDAHDRHANLETSFLLQKMEEYEGITVLASNIRQNMDNAFLRRINFIIEFPFPDGKLRAKLWQKIFPERAPLDPGLDFTFLSKKMELTGGNIKNIALAAAYNASANGDNITMTHLIKAAKREIEKMGKPFIVSEYLPHSEFLNKNKTEVR
ncbi:MAG: AAA family ATPase, partial [Leptospirales bacterium]